MLWVGTYFRGYASNGEAAEPQNWIAQADPGHRGFVSLIFGFLISTNQVVKQSINTLQGCASRALMLSIVTVHTLNLGLLMGELSFLVGQASILLIR
jgi:hypothetical protein